MVTSVALPGRRLKRLPRHLDVDDDYIAPSGHVVLGQACVCAGGLLNSREFVYAREGDVRESVLTVNVYVYLCVGRVVCVGVRMCVHVCVCVFMLVVCVCVFVCACVGVWVCS